MKLFYESDGSRLAYWERGSGLPVVFLHPTPVDHAFWKPLIERLAGVRAIVPDLRGHGASELGTLPAGEFAGAPDAPALTMAQLATDVLALLEYLKIEKAILVGCSIGGYVLLELWRRVPERIVGLGFICSKPQPDAEAGREKRAGTIAQARAGKKEALFDGMVKSSVGATAQTRRQAIVPELRARMTLTAEALVATQAGLATRPDSLATVATIRVPLLAVAGGEDQAVSASEMQTFLGATGARVDYTFFPKAGHFAAYEQPDAVAKVVQNWLISVVSDDYSDGGDSLEG